MKAVCVGFISKSINFMYCKVTGRSCPENMIQELFSKHKSKVNFISTAQSTTSALEGFKIFTTYITDSCTGYTPEAH